MGDHTAVAVIASGDAAWVAAILENWRTAPIDDRLRAMLGYLEKVTLTPEAVAPADVLPLRAAGLSDTAVEEALYVAFLFNVLDRLADAFDFAIPTAAGAARHGKILYRLGYGMACVPG